MALAVPYSGTAFHKHLVCQKGGGEQGKSAHALFLCAQRDTTGSGERDKEREESVGEVGGLPVPTLHSDA